MIASDTDAHRRTEHPKGARAQLNLPQHRAATYAGLPRKKCWLQVGLLALLLAGGSGDRAPAAEPPPIRISPLHVRPKSGNAGDVIAFHWQGQYHVFYLHGGRWAHNVSTDLLHWKELPPALGKGSDPIGPDGQACWTGSIVERGGTFYLFYTGKNSKDPKGDQKVMLATSNDLVRWEKQPERTFYADGKIYWSKPVNGPAEPAPYAQQAFRDPDVFWHEREQQWWMLLRALTAEGHHPCIGVYSSRDLLQWTPRAPLAKYATGVPLDCPHAAPMLGRWFVLAAHTNYVSTETPEGPYPSAMQPYESGNLFVPKSLFDGRRRLLWGWIQDLEGNRDTGKPLWGGTLCLAREIYPGTAGQLYCRPAAEVTAAFGQTAFDLASQPRPGTPSGTWRYQDGRLNSGPDGGACRFSVPDDYMLQCTVQIDPAATLTVGLRQQEDGAAYPLVINPKKQEVSLSRGKSRFARAVELDATKPISIQAFVQGAIIECFINDRFAFTCRVYDLSKGELGLKVEGGPVTVLSLVAKTLPQTL